MRKLVFILIAFIAAVTFIRAFDTKGDTVPVLSEELSGGTVNFDTDH
jgi:hypothetical protein